MMNKFIEVGSEKIPALGLGTYSIEGANCTNSVADALSMGYRHIDTAQMYNNEQAVGAGIHQSGVERASVFVTTKVLTNNFSKARLIKSVEESLRKLKCGYVDLLLLHWPADDETNKIALEQLLICKEKNYTRLIGVSNFTMNQLLQAQEVAPVICNQVEYHPYLSQQPMLCYLQQQGLMLTAYRPLAMGKILKNPLIISLAEKYKRSPNQIALHWLIQQKNVAAIPKASDSLHRKSNLQIFDFSIDDSDMESITQLNTNTRYVNPSFAPVWDK